MLTELCLEAVSRVRQKMVRGSLQSAAKKRTFLGEISKVWRKMGSGTLQSAAIILSNMIIFDTF
jgi:hypothetical protein